MTDDSQPPASSPKPNEEGLARAMCRCGHNRDHYMVSAECKYTGWGWFWVTAVGASARPVKAVFRCRQCQDIIDETDDPAIMRTLV